VFPDGQGQHHCQWNAEVRIEAGDPSGDDHPLDGHKQEGRRDRAGDSQQ